MVNVKEVVLERSFPVGPKFEMQKIRMTILTTLNDPVSGIISLCRVLDQIVAGYHKQRGNKPVSAEPAKKEAIYDNLPKEPIPQGIYKDDTTNTERIKKVQDMLPDEFASYNLQVYIQNDKICIKKYLPPKDYAIVSKFMESIDAVHISAGSETRWELPN